MKRDGSISGFCKGPLDALQAMTTVRSPACRVFASEAYNEDVPRFLCGKANFTLMIP